MCASGDCSFASDLINIPIGLRMMPIIGLMASSDFPATPSSNFAMASMAGFKIPESSFDSSFSILPSTLDKSVPTTPNALLATASDVPTKNETTGIDLLQDT